ncbi:MAG: FapA family protein [bacterium]|nr:FapA family protein [bacterium]
MNGYFQLITSGNGTAMRLIPETDGGEPIRVNEVANYLKYKRILFNLKQLNDGIEKHEETVVQLGLDAHMPEQEMCFITVSDDKLHAFIRFYAPSDNGVVMSRDEIMNELALNKIVYGVLQENIDAFLAKREYCKTYELAVGQSAKSGKDSQIEYFFSTDLQAKPKLNEDGSVDFFNLGAINHCKKGDVLAKLHPELRGEPGTNVYGENLAPPSFEKKILKFGRNVAINEDKTVLTAETDGHVELEEDRVCVSDIFEVDNVDTSTGNIEFEGSVHIKGNICENYSVKAHGNVVVGGVVEGAYVETDGDIIISRGMNGMDKGTLKAKGNIISKFLENTTAEAGGYIETECILHSTVTAGDEVIVTGKRAFVTGGHVTAANRITAKTLGSQMAAATTLEVGVNPEIRQRYAQLQKETADLQNSLKQIEPVVQSTMLKLKQGVKLTPEQVKYIQTLSATGAAHKKQIEENLKEMDDLSGQFNETAPACVIVSGVAYPGTKIVISDISLTLRQEYRYCRFRRVRGDVKSEPL